MAGRLASRPTGQSFALEAKGLKVTPMGVNDPRYRNDGHGYGQASEDDRMVDLADRLSAARRNGDPMPEEIERIVGLLARNDMDPGERLSRAVESLARWAEDEKPALRGAVPSAPRREEPRQPEQRQPELRDELEDRLADFARSLSSPSVTSVRQQAQAPQIAAARPQIHATAPTPAPATPPVASLRAALAEIAARQKSLDDEYEPEPVRAPTRAPADPSILRELRSELDTLGHSIAELPTRSEIDSLTREMTTLAARIGAERPAQLDGASLKAIDALVSEVDRMRSDAPSPQAISSLAEELHAISARLDVIGPRNSDAIDALARRIEDVRAEMNHFPRVAAVDEVASEIKSIITRLDAQEKAATPTREAVAGLSGRVHALDGRLSAMADAAVKRDDALQRINDTIRAELDSLPRAEAVTDLGRQIDALTEGLKSRSAIGPALKAVEGLAGKVDALDGKFAAVRQDSFDVLGRQIETLTASLGSRDEAIAAPVQALSGKLDALGDRMETMTNATRQRGAAFERIEESVRTIAEQLLASRNGAVAGSTLEKEASRLLERLETTDGRMDDLHAAFAGLASRIERSCEDLGAKTAQTAIAAARDTLGAATSGGKLDSEISQALSEMRASATQSERRAADALEAVRSTLDKLLDRMERIGAPTTYNHSAALEQALKQPARPEPVVKEQARQEPARQEPARQESARQEPLRQEPARRSGPDATEAAARRAMAEIEAGEPAPVTRPPFADVDPDQPLEPGARPTLGGHETAASLIAAARRANTQAVPEFAAEAAMRAKPERKSFVSGAISSLKARRRPLLLGIAATLIVFAALYVASGMTGAPVEEPAPAPAPQSRLEPKHEPKVAYQSETNAFRADRANDAGTDYQAAKSFQTNKDNDARRGEDRRAEAENPDIDAPRRASTTTVHEDAGRDPATTASVGDAPAADQPADKSADAAPATEQGLSNSSFAFSGGNAKTRANEWQAGEQITTGSIDRLDSAGLPEKIGGQLLRTRAAAGDAAAQLEIGDRLLEGRKVESDPAAAAKWLEKAASQGLAPAQQRLGSLYEKGRGVPRDVSSARRWYEQAAASGNVRAMHNLGVIHAEGGLGKPDYNAAVVWFRMASDRGLVDSQYNLAVLNARGLGGKRDLVGAYKWFSLAAQQGDADAGRKRDDVAKALGNQLSVAKAEVAAFRARNVDASANEDPPAPGGGWDRMAERRDEASRVR